jgi:hypothetical protein
VLHGHAAVPVVAEFPALGTHHKGPLAADRDHLHPAGLPWPLVEPAFQGNGLGHGSRYRRDALSPAIELNRGQQHQQPEQQHREAERMASPDR